MRRAIVLGMLLTAAACAPVRDAGPIQDAGPIRETGPIRDAKPVPAADFVLVDKSDRTLTLYANGRPVRTFTGLQYGDAPQGHKQFEGDERTPEGRYTIDYRNPRSAYHLSLHISYPSAQDRAFAQAQRRSPGGDIFIHGQPNGLPMADAGMRMPGEWTDGCIALTNGEMDILWQAIPDGTPIEIRP